MNNAEFYATLLRLHETKLSYLRFGQLIIDFEYWLKRKYQTDMFYYDNQLLIDRLNEFAADINTNEGE